MWVVAEFRLRFSFVMMSSAAADVALQYGGQKVTRGFPRSGISRHLGSCWGSGGNGIPTTELVGDNSDCALRHCSGVQ